MSTLILQNFVDRIRQDERPLQPSIYSELGVVIARQCEVDANRALSEEARHKGALIFIAEIRSPHSCLHTYHHFGAVFQRFCVSHFVRSEANERLMMSFLDTCKQDFRSQTDEDDFVNAMKDKFSASEDHERESAFAYAVNWLSKELPSIEINRDARNIATDIIVAAFATHLQVPSTHQATGRNLAPLRPLPTPSPYQLGPLETRNDFAELTRLMGFWLSIHFDDLHKTNCIKLVELLEIACEDVGKLDFSQIDFLNDRGNIFAEQPKATEAFYDGEI